MIHAKLTHPNCENASCNTCFADHLTLSRDLDRLCGTGNKYDHLGRIHSWMRKNGKEAETEHGWATPETFEPENINAYVRAFKESK